MKTIGRFFVRGVGLLLPLIVTGYVLVTLLKGADALFGSWMRPWMPEGMYRQGFGLLAGIALVFLVGLSGCLPVIQGFWRLVDSWLLRVPVVQTIYGAVSDCLRFLTGEQKQRFSQVVMVQVGQGERMMGLVTRKDFSDLPAGIGATGDVVVYLPMGYQMGGLTLIVPPTAITPVKFSIEEAMRFAFTAGLPGAAAATAHCPPPAKHAQLAT